MYFSPTDERSRKVMRSDSVRSLISRMLFVLMSAGPAIVVVVGCWPTRAEQIDNSPEGIDRFARSQEPGELMERIIQGEAACGGAEGQSVLRAAYSLKRQEFDRALFHVAKVSPVGPYRSTSLWIAGEALYRTGKLSQSIQILNSLISEVPDDLEGHRCLAAVYFDISAMQEARAELEHVIRLAPEDYRPHHLLGQIDLDFEKHGWILFRRMIQTLNCRLAGQTPYGAKARSMKPEKLLTPCCRKNPHWPTHCCYPRASIWTVDNWLTRKSSSNDC